MWQLSGTVARYTTSVFTAEINVAEPWQGLTHLQYRGEAVHLPGILQADVRELVAAEVAVHEVYIRGRDLVATYIPSPKRPVRMQIYWRAVSSVTNSSIAGIELILSAQTDLLDSNPQVHVRSKFASGELIDWNSKPNHDPLSFAESCNLYLFRPADANFSYCEMIHSTDFASMTLCRLPNRVDWTLFPERLEKGVIRRSRLCGLFLPREQDELAAVEAYQQFEAEPLPLTT